MEDFFIHYGRQLGHQRQLIFFFNNSISNSSFIWFYCLSWAAFSSFLRQKANSASCTWAAYCSFWQRNANSASIKIFSFSSLLNRSSSIIARRPRWNWFSLGVVWPPGLEEEQTGADTLFFSFVMKGERESLEKETLTEKV